MTFKKRQFSGKTGHWSCQKDASFLPQAWTRESHSMQYNSQSKQTTKELAQDPSFIPACHVTPPPDDYHRAK